MEGLESCGLQSFNPPGLSILFLRKKQYPVFPFDFLPLDPNIGLVKRIHPDADVIRLDGQVTVETAVNERQQFDPPGAAIVLQRSECSLNGAARVEYIVHQYHIFVFHQKIDFCHTGTQRFGPVPEIVPVEGDVKFAVFDDGNADDFDQPAMDSVCQWNTSLLDAYKAGIFEGVVIFNQLMAKPVNGEGKALLR